jgi:hypothetical protein
VVHPYLSLYEKFSSSCGGAFERFLVSWWCASLVYCNFICLFVCFPVSPYRLLVSDRMYFWYHFIVLNFLLYFFHFSYLYNIFAINKKYILYKKHNRILSNKIKNNHMLFIELEVFLTFLDNYVIMITFDVVSYVTYHEVVLIKREENWLKCKTSYFIH